MISVKAMLKLLENERFITSLEMRCEGRERSTAAQRTQAQVLAACIGLASSVLENPPTQADGHTAVAALQQCVTDYLRAYHENESTYLRGGA